MVTGKRESIKKSLFVLEPGPKGNCRPATISLPSRGGAHPASPENQTSVYALMIPEDIINSD